MTSPSGGQKIVLENRLAEVPRAEDFVLKTAESHGFDGSDQFAIKLALEEALANAIKHGNGMDPSKSVTIECECDDDLLTISISDQGDGFNPEDVPDPTLDENLEKPYGRGVMLMRTYMTDIKFRDNGTCVILTKKRSPAKSSD